MDIESAKKAGKVEGVYAVLKKLKFRQGEGQNSWKSLQAFFSDATDDINSSPVYGNDPMFDVLHKIPEGSHVKVHGIINEYGDEKQVRISSIRQAGPSDEDYDPSKLMRKTPNDIEEMFLYLEERAGSMSEGELRDITIGLVSQYAEELKKSPASVEIHHAYYGGLLEHVWRMLKIHEGIESLYPFSDRDVVISGIILHDLGKIFEYSLKKGGAPALTDSGELFGHIYIGASIIQNEATGIKAGELSPQVKNLLHIVLSHHGKREYGSPQPPKTAEAWLVHLIDYLESRMQIAGEEIKKIKPGKWSQQKIWPLENARLVNLRKKDE
ncbi:HD domain-containing protein [candidate division WOR-3 bacterium]|nr:HD domain-containing protein [candidate division WOR-3 bacterium]